MKKLFISLLCVIALSLQAKVIERYYFTRNAAASLRSETPQQLITASTDQVSCVVDPLKKTVVIRIPVSSFANFSEKSYHEQFNQKLMESDLYTDIVFTGRLPADFSELKKGMQSIHVFGTIDVHGVRRERTLVVNIFMAEQMLVMNTLIPITLAHHHIEIPKALDKKFAAEMKIEINARMRMTFADESPVRTQ